jgi:cytochrome c peroxidase
MKTVFPALVASFALFGWAAYEPVLGTPKSVTHPKENPYSEAKAELGRKLFFEGRLSKTGETPCTWCHNPLRGWADGRTISIGDPQVALKRHTPSLLNVAYSEHLFWDGRSKTLEEQAPFPIQHPDEMNMKLEDVPGRLKSAGYEKEFLKAFGSKEITVDKVVKALSCFQRTLTENDTPYDHWVAGKKGAMSATAVKGLELFKGKAGCVQCHSGPNFSRAYEPGQVPYAATGVFQSPVLDPDGGRMDFDKDPKMKGMFRIPSLRGVGKTYPYMHNGSIENLEDVVEFYNRGGDEGLLKKLNLTATEKKSLVEFLRYGITEH